ncbi:MAG: flagellar export chaperone FlgN [Bacteriovoracaceae bacterium]|jgi:flagellar biosynthesis/type III secretory pathway chaperone|nr:hypothetical protein [Halobacteriovoraceae bacterium]MDP7321802.1 flagellar export chaperone FlgN [Bacteriovoracaceae bacterium]|tara:strand:- start:833 stop:1324 length:492 start_codon:yes stop_codon:yes gene_type:complete
MNEKQQLQLKLKLNELRELWHHFCEKHTELYEFTCDEYIHLMSSNIEELDNTLKRKNETISSINQLETQRSALAEDISALYQVEKTHKLSELIEVLKDNKELSLAAEIEGLNAVLLDIINKIQEQNKKNQVFLNKAIISLNELKESFGGKVNFKTYSSNGMTR